jgi:hypothetical protein
VIRDLVGELEAVTRAHLMGQMPPDPSGELVGMTLGCLLIRWFNWRDRFVPTRPRFVHTSTELESGPAFTEHAEALAAVIVEIESGQDLTPLRQIRKEKTEAVADMSQKQRVGQIADLSDAQEYEDLLARERSVVSGHTDVEFCGFVTVTAPSREALDAARSIVTRAASQAACEVRPLYGRQAQAFVVATLPLARSVF